MFFILSLKSPWVLLTTLIPAVGRPTPKDWAQHFNVLHHFGLTHPTPYHHPHLWCRPTTLHWVVKTDCAGASHGHNYNIFWFQNSFGLCWTTAEKPADQICYNITVFFLHIYGLSIFICWYSFTWMCIISACFHITLHRKNTLVLSVNTLATVYYCNTVFIQQGLGQK